jgi:hypothetical protein
MERSVALQASLRIRADGAWLAPCTPGIRDAYDQHGDEYPSHDSLLTHFPNRWVHLGKHHGVSKNHIDASGVKRYRAAHGFLNRKTDSREKLVVAHS